MLSSNIPTRLQHFILLCQICACWSMLSFFCMSLLNHLDHPLIPAACSRRTKSIPRWWWRRWWGRDRVSQQQWSPKPAEFCPQALWPHPWGSEQGELWEEVSDRPLSWCSLVRQRGGGDVDSQRGQRSRRYCSLLKGQSTIVRMGLPREERNYCVTIKLWLKCWWHSGNRWLCYWWHSF